MVWAICGRMPLMMQSAPIRRAAAMVFIRCCATRVSTVGTPVMSMMAIAAPVSTIFCSRLSITTWVRAVERADQRQRQHAVPQLDHRGRQLQQFLLLAHDDLVARFLEHFDGEQAQLVEQRAREDNGIACEAAEVIVTNGAKQALYEALYAMTDPGDSVIVFRPYWPAYLATIELLGLRAVLVDLPATVTQATLDALPAAKVLVINNPHNPTGKVFDAAELGLLAGWMARSGCHAIVDESYEKLIFDGGHASLAALCDWRALGVVTIFSASQSYAMMGWRTGFAVAPRQLVDAMETLQGPITAAASALTQIACDAAFASGDPVEMLRDYRARRDLVMAMVAEVPWLRMHCPASGPYLWGDVGALGVDTLEFADRLLDDERVAIMPGDALGMPGYIRIGYISDDTATLREGVGRILRFGGRLAAAAR
jgi:aspartate aminotransferase